MRRQSLPEGWWLLAGLTGLCTVIEALLSMGDAGILPKALRQIAYDNFGFWPGLLQSWQPNYALQPYAMFATYGFLHGDAAHLAMNMVTLWILGLAILGRVRPTGFALLYGGSLIGGAWGYGLLASGLQPMVGASGAIFGLAGGILAWTYVDRFSAKRSLWPVAQVVALLVALNLVMWVSFGGNIAWQTHLGGFVTGWVLALLIDPRPNDPT